MCCEHKKSIQQHKNAVLKSEAKIELELKSMRVLHLVKTTQGATWRSEERRVGKECRL